MNPLLKKIKALLGRTTESVADEPKNKSNSDKVEQPIENILVHKKTVEALISNGNTEKVLLQLQKAGYSEATIAYKKYKDKARLMNMGVMDTREWHTLQKQLCEDILTWAYLEETRPQILLTEAQKLHIKQLLKYNQTADALNLCKGLGDKHAVLMGCYTRIMKDKVLNLLTESEQKAHLTAINEAIEEWVS